MNDFSPDPRPSQTQPRRFLSLILTVVVHIGLLGFLFYGIAWQSKPLGSLEVGLVGAPAAPEPPKPEPPPPPPEPPKPEPPKQEPPKPADPPPEIATKKPEPPKQEKKAERKPPEPPPLKPIDFQKQLDKAIERTVEAKKVGELLGSEQRRTPAKPGELDAYRSAIRDKIRRNLVAPPSLSGNPEAVIAIEQVQTSRGGELIGEPQIKRSSGNPALDEAILRAVRKSNPLPLPENRDLFERTLNITFKPMEE